MDVHQNARTKPLGRSPMAQRVAEGRTIREVTFAFGIDSKTVREWRDRPAEG